MTSEEFTGVHNTSRRMFLRGAALLGTSAVAAGATSMSLVSSARASSTDSAASPGANVPIQWAWAWCSKCQVLYYTRGSSACPAGGEHGGQKSYNYGMYYNGGGANWQPGWAFCVLCSGLFYAHTVYDGAHAGICPRYWSSHAVVNSYNYIAFYNSARGYTNTQPGWLWCNQCYGMFYGNKSSRAGVCPLGQGAFSHYGGYSYPYQMID